jgi:UDP-N-acetylmuramoyl-tripeptide--D-alanyl-D-alanine ligase
LKPLSVREILQAVSGRPLSPIVDGPPLVRSVCTDSRRMEPHSLFIAIKGERFDGHEKLSDAAGGGAIAALVEHEPRAPMPNLQLIGVANTRLAMGRLATHVRRQLQATVIAVGGSNGKTSTKFLLHHVLETKFKGSISPKSFNNDIGVPLAIFPADPAADYLVLEIGTNRPGEIKALSELARPNIAVITSIGAEHLEGLSDIDGVRAEEASLVSGLDPCGVLIVNGDDERLLELVRVYRGRRITFGFGSHNDLFATDVRCEESGVRFKLNGSRREIFVPMLGRHVASNALATFAVARWMNMPEEAIAGALAHADGPEMRLQVSRVHGMTLLNDAYNANPASMRAALETIRELPSPGRRVAVVGDMRELGRHAARYHRETGEFAAQSKLDVLICVGTSAKLIARAAEEAGMPRSRIRQYPDSPTAARAVPRWLKKGDLVLFKASRGVQLETVVNAVVEKRQARRRLAS